MSTTEKTPHPGERIRNEVIPSGMSVTRAAELIGVGRPALSNLLNGKASLSADMATRIERAFKFPRKDLMEMQAQYDAAKARAKSAPAETRAYVPPFLTIKANQIESWVDRNIPSRSRLSVFLRTLVNSTGIDLTEVNFPGNDDAERPGWDGYVESGGATPWIPIGRSGWEFGTDKGVKKKADNDFQKSVKAIDRDERQKTTFVFVTPRNWPGKEVWRKSAIAKGEWKDVRVYDSSDLEQWLEQSLAGQAWFANEIDLPSHGVRSLDVCWRDWADVADPPLPGSLFASAIEAFKRTMRSRLQKPSDGPIIIAADSTEEALAFIAQILGKAGGEELATYRDRVLVFDEPGVLPRLAKGAQSFIPVVYTQEVERDLAPYLKSLNAIVIYTRNPATSDPDIVLEPVNYEVFQKSLEAAGMTRDQITLLDNESGRSLTVLRRRLASLDAIRRPHWATDFKIARSLVPFLFVGTWQHDNDADCQGLSLLADDRPYQELEQDIQSLTCLADSPVWSIGKYRGIVSKLDLLYAISWVVTPHDLERYFDMARMVLGEDDPALDLEEENRWAAAFHGKTREFSEAFRNGISETLVLLAVHGGSRFKKGLGIDSELQAAMVVRDLLPTPLQARTLEANSRDLPTYAEAAPEEFLSILERDLQSEESVILNLLRPATNGVFIHPARSGLLWALEGLAWNPHTLSRAAILLARLSQVEIKDNWINKPLHSLQAIFRAWMPQTSASLEDRVALVKMLAEQFPDVAWKVCIAQFGTGGNMGDYSHKPRWRSDGFGAGEPLPTWGPVLEFQREMVELALRWRVHSVSMLTDLIERLHGIDDGYRDRVWELIENWAKTRANDEDKSAIREAIRINVLSRRAVRHLKRDASFAALTSKAKAALDALEPLDLVNKHAWLFREDWIQESADEIEVDEEIDFEKREQRIQSQRIDAMREIWVHRGMPALLELAERGKASGRIGFLAARHLFSEAELLEFLALCVKVLQEARKASQPYENLITGALQAFSEGDKLERILASLTSDLPEGDALRLFLLAPFGKCTWTLIESAKSTLKARYWSLVTPVPNYHSDADNQEAAAKLLDVNRPRAAFWCVRFHPEKLDAGMLFRLMSKVAAGGDDKPGEFLLDNHDVEKAFKVINASSIFTLDQKAGLEFTYIDILRRRSVRPDAYGIPNLERYVEAHPEAFIQAIVWAYKRRDGLNDPDEFRVPEEQISGLAERGHKLLGALQRIPGHNDLGELEKSRLLQWVMKVRCVAEDLSRLEISDHCIGQLLANAPIGEDGVWPCDPVRQVFEQLRSESIMEGAAIAIYNSRGVHFRGEGGDQERELAAKYRKWGESLQFSHPYLSSKLLMAIARNYDREASDEDTRASIRRRLR